MWLLNAHTREMREFVSYKQAPHYAILSHTWGDEEVSFKDWQDGAWEHMEQKEGFRKIDGCCRQAVAESLDWVWIDTCCIDKRSSAELSEAINSMFNWYKRADVCYAYLRDVSDDIENNFAGCRWVTRGWTLQELIAPRNVVFYSGDWKALGTRSELAGFLATVTGIDKRFLTGKALGDASIAQRMSWAAGRETSREEDEAYCLLGIFDVNMSLIYGEGSKAFKRLQELLAREYPEDHSLFAWGKIVERLSNQVDDDEQKWEPEPIPYDHNHKKAEIKYLGLLAESPKDFQHSGQIVRAPQATYFFRFGPKSSLVLTLFGRTAQIGLPVSRQGPTHILNYLKYPPIVQVLGINWIILLCGQWNDSIPDFQFATIPVITNTSSEACRLDEMVIGDSYTEKHIWQTDLLQVVQRCSFAPIPPIYPQSGNIMLRRCISGMPWEIISDRLIDISIQSGLINSHNSAQGLLFYTSHETKQGLGLTLTCVRLDALDHSHENPTHARDFGALSFFFNPFALPGHADPELKIINNRRSFRDVGTQEKLNTMSFSNIQEAGNYGSYKWREIKYQHNMVQPWDEWRISAIGLADVYISVERFFLNEYESDKSSSSNASHHFIDIVDIVVKRNTEDNTVKDDGDRQQKNNDSTEEQNAAREALNEGNVNDVKRKKKEKDDGRDGNWEDTDEWSTCDESTDDNASTGI